MRIAAFALVAFSVAATAQPAVKIPHVAFVATTSSVSELRTVSTAARGFSQGLKELGYVEGKNIVVEWRSAEGKFERFPDIMRELIRAKVDLIVTIANPMTQVAKGLTKTIPIVMIASTMPVEAGLVSSLARPGGNITGITVDAGPEIIGKRLQLLKELSPTTGRVVVLGFGHGLEGWTQQEAETVARATRVQLEFVDPEPKGYEASLALLARKRVDAILVAQATPNFSNRRLIAEFGAKARLPIVYPARDYVADAGGLVAYGPDIGDVFRRGAHYVDRILKGAKPGDLPVERPTKFHLVINLKVARALGLVIPSALLVRADEVID